MERRKFTDIVTIQNGAITASGNSGTIDLGYGEYCQLDIFINVTAISGTPNNAIKLQLSNDGGTTWFDHPTVTFTAMTAVGTQVKLDSPVGGATTARLNYTVTGGTPSLTTKITAQARTRG